MEAVDWIDSVEKGRNVIRCLEFSTAYERVSALKEYYPSLSLSHRVIGNLLGLQRETVTRTLCQLKKEDLR